MNQELHHRHTIHRKRKWPSVLAAAMTATLPLSAADLFEISVPVINNAPVRDFRVGGSSIIDLVENLILAEGQFRQLDLASSYIADATYWGLRDALIFDFRAVGGGYSATLRSSVIPLNESFGGPGVSRPDLDDEIEEWLKSNGASKLAELDAAVSKLSAAAPNDGNPFATTAELSDNSFGRFASGRESATARARDAAADQAGVADTFDFTWGLGATFGYYNGSVKTPAGKLNVQKLTVPIEFGFGGDRLRLDVSIPLSYTDIQGASIFGLGLDVGLPWTIISARDESRWRWMVTPLGGIMGRASVDGANGALIYTFGLANRVEYEISDSLRVGVGSQIGTFHDIGITIGDIDIKRDIDQRVVKNGINLTKDWSKWTLEGHVIDTRFLEDAAIKDYQTYGGAAIYNFSKSFYAGVGVDYIYDSKFDALRVGLSSSFRF